MEKISNPKKPLIKKFKTKSRYYIYDVNTNEIFGVNKTVYDIEEFCTTMRDTIERDLITYCEIIEENPTAFNDYKNMIIR